MNTLAFLFGVFLMPMVLIGQEPLEADAGKDSTFCSTPPDSIELGGHPAASGGGGDYNYEWDIHPKPYIPYSNAPNLKYYASDILSDTSQPNPKLSNTLLPNVDMKSLAFILTVTDDSLNVDNDTIQFLYVNWVTSTSNLMITTYPGDTQTVSPILFGGGLPPYKFDWGQSPDLIGNQFDYDVYPDVSLPTRQVVIPSGPSPKWYGLTVTDMLGCTTQIGTYQGFLIEPLGVLEPKSHSQVQVIDRTVLIESSDQISNLAVFNPIGQILTPTTQRNGSHGQVQFQKSGFFILRIQHVSNQVETFKIYIQ